MKRRDFVSLVGAGGGLIAAGAWFAPLESLHARPLQKIRGEHERLADLVIAGGGLGGCACALAALRNGLRVIMIEETDWIGGQLTQQGVPPDEHRWIETHGATVLYRSFRTALRDYYRRSYPLTHDARNRENLNPGNGLVSRLCVEPRAGVAVLLEMLAPYLSSGQLILLSEHQVTDADVTGNRVQALTAQNLRTEIRTVLTAPYFVDATELGDLLPLTGTEYVTGTESGQETGELHAPEKGDPHNEQAFTLCFAMDYVPGKDHVTDKPEQYDFWKSYIPALTPAWPGQLLSLTYSTPATLVPKTLGFHPEGESTGEALNLWNYRKIIDRKNFREGMYRGDITLVNWPQNDYLLGNLTDVDQKEFNKHIAAARQLNLSLLYWLQTEAPRPDGGTGWPGLRLRPDIMGSEDGMAKYPYIRESRRIRPVFRVLEEHIGTENRMIVAGPKAGKKAADFKDSIGIGSYYLDLHPTTRGNNYINLPSLPFQIPLGALLPQRMENLLPANKNIGTTHITNGCYRLHPVEWNIGESAGMLVYYALQKKVLPHEVRENPRLLDEFQQLIRSQGIETHWPDQT